MRTTRRMNPIKKAREAAKMSREDVASKVGISDAYLGHLERGSPVYLSEALAEKIMKKLKLPKRQMAAFREAQNRRAAAYYSEYRRRQNTK